MLILAPLGQATITERSLTLASTWVRQARYVTPQSQDVFVKLSGSCSPCSPHRIHRGGPALIGRQDCVPASSGKSQSSQRHQDSQPVFVVVFRRQIAHVAVSADLLQREPPQIVRPPESRATSRPSVALAPIQFGCACRGSRNCP